jgi:streptogrisin C
MEVDSRIEGIVGQAFGGSWFDAKLGKLVVGVTQAQSVAAVRAAGAEARVVEHSLAELDAIQAELDAIQAELDALAGKAAGSDKAQRAVGGKRQSAVAGLTTWYVDPTTNSVVTAASTQARAAALSRLDKDGDAVRVEVSSIAPTTTANFMDVGAAINGGSCSAGFNLRNSATGQGYLLTAGHCVTAGTTTTGQGGLAFGAVLESWFPHVLKFRGYAAASAQASWISAISSGVGWSA